MTDEDGNHRLFGKPVAAETISAWKRRGPAFARVSLPPLSDGVVARLGGRLMWHGQARQGTWLQPPFE